MSVAARSSSCWTGWCVATWAPWSWTVGSALASRASSLTSSTGWTEAAQEGVVRPWLRLEHDPPLSVRGCRHLSAIGGAKWVRGHASRRPVGYKAPGSRVADPFGTQRSGVQISPTRLQLRAISNSSSDHCRGLFRHSSSWRLPSGFMKGTKRFKAGAWRRRRDHTSGGATHHPDCRRRSRGGGKSATVVHDRGYARPSSRIRAVMSFFTRRLGGGFSMANFSDPFDVS